MKEWIASGLSLILLASAAVIAGDDGTVTLGNTRSQNNRWALRILAIDGQPVSDTAVASRQRIFSLSPGRHTLRLGRWEQGTGTRLAGSAEQAGVIRDLEVLVEAGGHYRVEGTGRGSHWSPALVSE